MNENVEMVKIKKFEWSIEGLDKVIRDLKLESGDYAIDIREKRLYVYKNGFLLQDGDSYIVPIEPLKNIPDINHE